MASGHEGKSEELKIVVLGAGGVGKSALTVQYVQGVFIDKYDPTIEDSYRKTVSLPFQSKNDATEIYTFALEILDTAGTEQFTAMRDLYLKTGHAFVLVYSITSTSTFHELVGIRDQLLRVKNAASVPMILVGNKIDLSSGPGLDEQRVVTFEQGRALATKWGVPFIETSARRNINIEQAFTLLLQEHIKTLVRKQELKKRHGGKKKKRCTII